MVVKVTLPLKFIMTGRRRQSTMGEVYSSHARSVFGAVRIVTLLGSGNTLRCVCGVNCAIGAKKKCPFDFEEEGASTLR